MGRYVEGQDRRQAAFLPDCLDDYVDAENPVRVIDAFVDELDLGALGFERARPAATGRPAYHPAMMLKLYVYGYMNRVQSSRRLEREAGRNVELMWLTGKLAPDFKTIADFRRDNADAIKAAAWRLAQTPEWKAARTIECNPDPPQIPVRLRALLDGKILYAPVPNRTKDFPYLRIDPARLLEKGVSCELAATSEGYLMHGERIGFGEVEPLDFCVVGSVAVGRGGGRTGKGASFADLDTGIFRALGTFGPATPLATTVHSVQLVPDEDVVLEPHDSPLDYIATEAELIATGNTDPRPAGVAWERVRPGQFERHPLPRRPGRAHDRRPA